MSDVINSERRQLFLLVPESELEAPVRDLLESVPFRVRFVSDAATATREARSGTDLVLTVLDVSVLSELARGLTRPEPSGESGSADASGEVRARAPRLFSSHALYDEALAYVDAVLSAVRRGVDPDVDQGRIIAERVHTDLLRGNGLVRRSLEPHESYDLPSHCVNVSILAGKIALGMVSGVEDAVDVVHAGLVHDLGMARLPERMLHKQGTWSEREREELHKHPVYGAEILERCAPHSEWLRRAVLQEHERASGQGYPHGLGDAQMDPVARILGVADVFEALSHPRTYRSPYTALEALETVVGMQEEYFSAQVVSALVNEISAFPLDSFVQLSTGEIGRVVATDPSNLLRPIVEVVWDASWKRLEEPLTVDLSGRPDVTVARALVEADLPIT